MRASLALLALLLFLPGRAGLPPIDRDESRYMQATAQMLETGNYVDVRFQDAPRYLQPAGIYWLEAISAAAAPRAAWAYRMPSLLGAVAAVLLTVWIGTMLFGRGAGLAAGLLMAASVLLGAEARMAKIDATLLAAVLVAQGTLLRAYLGRGGPGWAALHWLALGVGLMLKGPPILLVTWGTILGLLVIERRGAWLRALRPAWGVPLMLAVVAPWLIAIGVVSGGAFFSQSVGDNFLGKVATGQQAHGGLPGYYLAVFVASFWPGSLFVVLAAPWAWARRSTPAMRFVAAWVAPTWVVFEAVATKLPHYVLPTYPALACVAGAALLSWPQAGWGRRVAQGFGAAWLVVGAALAVAAPVALWMLERRVDAGPVLLGVVALALLALAARAAWRTQPRLAVGASCASAALIYGSVYGLVLPQLDTIWIAPRAAAAVAAHRPCAGSVVASSGFSEPSLVFALGRSTRLVGVEAAADHLAADPACALALVDARQDATFRARLGFAPHALATVGGLNYTTGRRVALTLYGG